MLLIDTGNSVSTICIIVLTGKRGGATTYATDVGSNASTNATTTTSIALCVVFNRNFQLSLKPKGILLYSFDCLFSFAVSTPLALLPSNVKILGFLDKIPFKCQHLTNSLCFIIWSLH
jgi:hypothetical protein